MFVGHPAPYALSDAIGDPSASGVAPFVPIAVLVVGVVLVGAIVWALLVIRRRSIVRFASSALKALDGLNAGYRPHFQKQPAIRHDFTARVESKAKYDRFDLGSYLSRCVLDNEQWFEQEIGLRAAPLQHYKSYQHDFDLIEHLELGRSGDPRLRPEQFAAIERRLLNRQKLACPTPKARITSTVRYTSPKGKNSYASTITWDFEQLQYGLAAAQAERARQSTVQFLRKRERDAMTAGLRTKVMRRDSFRCQMCGASRPDGVTLHVDHILPVSHGGRTVLENLQTLCADCNLGKGNSFVG
ncbi:HNH endonuclease [Leifsonia poae]|uniref:HNH endonuclease n=1 Tax=Leifsonia poae TaxID=110933 RepID=UPI003D692E16